MAYTSALAAAWWRLDTWTNLIWAGIILGGLTTFSAFGWDTTRLFLDERPLLALANIGANVVAGLFAVWVGIIVVKSFW